MYNYDEVKEFFGDTCFRMSPVRGAVIFERKDVDITTNEDGFFRVGPYLLYLHDITGIYAIGSFAC